MTSPTTMSLYHPARKINVTLEDPPGVCDEALGHTVQKLESAAGVGAKTD